MKRVWRIFCLDAEARDQNIILYLIHRAWASWSFNRSARFSMTKELGPQQQTPTSGGRCQHNDGAGRHHPIRSTLANAWPQNLLKKTIATWSQPERCQPGALRGGKYYPRP